METELLSSSDLPGSASGHSEHQPVRESGPGPGERYQPTGDLKADYNFETVYTWFWGFLGGFKGGACDGLDQTAH